MKKDKRIYFLLTAEQWLGVILLLGLVVGTLVTIKHWQPKQEVITTWSNDSTKQEFTDYQHQQDSIRQANRKKQFTRDTIEIIMCEFNPNTVDSSTLVHLGFKPWQAKNLLKYRAKGGKYRTPEDLKKLYGMTDGMYLELEPYICIPIDTIDSTRADSIQVDSMRIDSLPRWKSEKKDTILNLRTADTTELKMIRGIGSYRARQIVRYREELGGYVSIEQIMEARGMDEVTDSILKFFTLDSVEVNTLKINHIGVRQLSRHPYLRFEEAKAIYEYRRKHIRIDSIQQLYELDCLSQEHLEKLAPYLNFDKNN